MQLPSPEEIAAAKVDAAQRFGRSEVLEVRLTAPIDLCILVAPFDLATYSQKADEDALDLQTSLRNTVHRHRLWPAADIITARLDKRPAAAMKIVGRMMLRAGHLPGDPAVEFLADVLARTPRDPDDAALAVLAPAKVSEVIPGLTRAAAEKLLAENAEAEIWTVVGPGPLSLVMATPEGEVWLASQTANQKALIADKKRVVHAVLDFALQAILWSRQPIESLLDDQPVLSRDIRKAYEIIGGEGAEATSKSL